MHLWTKHNSRMVAAVTVAMILTDATVSDCATSLPPGVDQSRSERTIYFSHQDNRPELRGRRADPNTKGVASQHDLG